MIRIGTDVIKISLFKKRALQSRVFLTNIFTDSEIGCAGGDYSRLAGWFAAKEAVTKALKLKVGSWKKIEILHEGSGRPLVKSDLLKDYKDFDLSISHDGDYAVAVFVVQAEWEQTSHL